MPDSTTGLFTEVGDFQVHLARIFAAITVTEPSPFSARVASVGLRHLHVVRASEDVPRIAIFSLVPDDAVISFSTDPALPLIWCGMRLCAGDIVVHRPGDRSHQRTVGASRWGMVSLRAASLAAYIKVETGDPWTPPLASHVVRPAAADWRDLLRLTGEATRLASTRPAVLHHPEVVRAMEYELEAVLVRCVAASEACAEPASMRDFARAMAALEDYLDADPCGRPGLDEIARAAGVSERTLRQASLAFLGVGPHRYIELRRLHLLRRSLRQAYPGVATIAELAGQAGYTASRRCHASYHATFGETPTTTLQRVNKV